MKSLLKISIGFIIKLAGDSQECMQIIFNDKLFTTIPSNKQTTSILSSKKIVSPALKFRCFGLLRLIVRIFAFIGLQ